MHRSSHLIGLLTLGLLVNAFCAGCASRDLPRSRIGALPFPGMFTLYGTADPERLGRHRYGHTPRLLRADEKERGILYTTRAGFLDVAHVRLTIDWTRYYTRHVRRAVKAGETELALAGTNDARFLITLRYPPDWATLPDAERHALTEELAVRSGQHLAYLSMAWHEAITWFGHRSVFFIDESPSSFTYDDTMSHVVGVRVAARAIRDTTRKFDDAVTVALAAELRDLGAVRPAQTDEAVRAVERLWWADGKPLKRQYTIGLQEMVVYPWLVRGPSFQPAAAPEPFHLPGLGAIGGRDFSGFCSVEIEPRILETNRMRDVLPGRPAKFRQRTDVPALLAVIASQMRDRFGPDVNEPWPRASGGAVAEVGGGDAAAP